MQLRHLPLLATLFSILSLSNAAPTAVNNKTPTPTYPFTLAAFISPYPLFSNTTYSPGINGIAVHASAGSFYVNPTTPSPTPATVFSVDGFGQAFLKARDTPQVYLNTRTGILGYTTSDVPAGVSVLNFLHLGEGSVVVVPITGAPGYFNAGPGSFNWLGSVNSLWFLCPVASRGYQVLKYVGGKQDYGGCLSGVQLVALDYTG